VATYIHWHFPVLRSRVAVTPFWSAHDIQNVPSFSQQTKLWIHQHMTPELDNFKIEYFHSAVTLGKLLSQFDFWLEDDSWTEDLSLIFRTLYSRDIFNCIQFCLAHLPIKTHLNCEWVLLADLHSCGIYSEMNLVIGGAIQMISSLPAGQLCQLFVHPTDSVDHDFGRWPFQAVVSLLRLWCYSIFPGSYTITRWCLYVYLIRNHELSLGFLYWIYLPDLFTYLSYLHYPTFASTNQWQWSSQAQIRCI